MSSKELKYKEYILEQFSEKDLKHYFGETDPFLGTSYYFVIIPPNEDDNPSEFDQISIFVKHQFDRDKEVFSPTVTPLDYLVPTIEFESQFDTLYSWNNNLVTTDKMRKTLTESGFSEINYVEGECYVG